MEGFDPQFKTAFSHDQRFLAIMIQLDDTTAIVVKDLVENQFTPFFVSRITYEFCFDRCYGLYFVEKDIDQDHGRKVYRADLSPVVDEDLKILEETRTHITKIASVRGKLVYSEDVPGFYVVGKGYAVNPTLSRDYIQVTSLSIDEDLAVNSSEVRLYDSSDPSSVTFIEVVCS